MIFGSNSAQNSFLHKKEIADFFSYFRTCNFIACNELLIKVNLLIAHSSYLGLLQLMLGLIAIFLKEYGLWFWIAGFGLVNVLCGAYIYFTYERAS
jgi:general stress protein CsbA